MLRGREEENVEETLVTCGKTAGKVATSAVAAAVSIFSSFYLVDKTQLASIQAKWPYPFLYK